MSTMIQRRPGLSLALVVVLALSVSGLALWTTVMAPAAHAATSTITTCTEQALTPRSATRPVATPSPLAAAATFP